MNILVTEFQGQGEGDVMIFTDYLTVEEVTQNLTEKGCEFTEIYEVKDEDLQYYLYEPCYIYKKQAS